MLIELMPGHGNTIAKITFQSGESLVASADAVLAMTTTLTLNDLNDSALESSHAEFSPEALRYFTAENPGGLLWLSGKKAGELLSLAVNHTMVFVKADAFLAATTNVDIDLDWRNATKTRSLEECTWLNIQGVGEAVLSAFGAAYCLDVDGDCWINESNILAYEETLDWSAAPLSPWQRFWRKRHSLSILRGRGRVWCQSHTPAVYAANISKYLNNNI